MNMEIMLGLSMTALLGYAIAYRRSEIEIKRLQPYKHLFCCQCSKPITLIAHNTGDGWYMGLGCQTHNCKNNTDENIFVSWFPEDRETMTGEELEKEYGFEIV